MGTDRITDAMLERRAAQLNRALGRPETPWQKTDGGRMVSLNGCLHIDSGYGGVSLAEMVGDGGGVSMPIGYTRHSKRALWDIMGAMLWAISAQGQMAQAAKVEG